MALFFMSVSTVDGGSLVKVLRGELSRESAPGVPSSSVRYGLYFGCFRPLLWRARFVGFHHSTQLKLLRGRSSTAEQEEAGPKPGTDKTCRDRRL